MSFETDYIHQEIIKRPKSKVYVFTRQDLKRNKYEKNLAQIDFHDVPDIKKLARAELCIFREETGTVKVIKSRYDIQGIILSNNQYEDYLRLLKKEKDENN